MGHLRRLLEARSLARLVSEHSPLRNAPQTGGARVRAARASGGSFLIFSGLFGEPFTIQKKRLPAKLLSPVTGTSVRPSRARRAGRLRNGRKNPARPARRRGAAGPRTDSQGCQTGTPPTRGRRQGYVPILEDEAAQLPPMPGMERGQAGQPAFPPAVRSAHSNISSTGITTVASRRIPMSRLCTRASCSSNQQGRGAL